MTTKRIVLVVSLLSAVLLGGLFLSSSHDTPPALADNVAPAKAAPDAAAVTAPTPQNKIRILIVPGHEPNSGGTSFRGLFERDLTVQLGQDLRDYLKNDGRYDVLMTRDAQGWNPVFESYFTDHRDEIAAWRDAAKSGMADRLGSGEVVEPVAPVEHRKADDDVSIELYGINKWAAENDVDLTLHLHFDEHRERPSSRPGPNTGFSVYVPAPQFGNSAATRPIAEKLFARLSKYDPVSDLGGEDLGIIDESDLIAVGSNDSAKAPSILVEYGYIYEQRFTDETVRKIALDDLAFQTALGLRDAFAQNDDAGTPFGTAVLPHAWQTVMTRKTFAAGDMFALQTALIADGEYPPKGKSGNECPRNGSFGDCTSAALAAFQSRYGIKGEVGYAGRKTLAKLNGLFSAPPKK